MERKHNKNIPRYWRNHLVVGKEIFRESICSFGKSDDALRVNVIKKLMSINSDATVDSNISVKADALFMILQNFR